MSDDMIVATVITDRAVYERHLEPCIDAAELERIVLVGDEGTCLARLYNEVLDATDQRFVVFTHPDVEFSPDLLATVPASSIVGGVGVVEAKRRFWSRSRARRYVWAGEVEADTEVACFDSCFLVADRQLGLRFDEELFDGLHLCVADYCYQARSVGAKCVVPAATHFEHHSNTVRTEGYRWGNYPEYRDRLERKWRRRFRVVTT
jgi:hypothetical protein